MQEKLTALSDHLFRKNETANGKQLESTDEKEFRLTTDKFIDEYPPSDGTGRDATDFEKWAMQYLRRRVFETYELRKRQS